MLMALMHKLFILILSLFTFTIESDECPSQKDAKVYFISPSNGYISSDSEIRIVFGIENFNILPAGSMGCNSGHHHFILNAELPNLSRPIPSSDSYIHFGKGQTETIINLKPGKHSLQLLLGDYAHIPHKKPIFSEKIYIEVINSE